ncbi:MAG: hypothetical protein ACPGMR_05215 [Pontibacterium sp.]
MSEHNEKVVVYSHEAFMCTPRPCPYFSDREEQLIVITDSARQRTPLDALYNVGFRRFGQEVCLVNCDDCSACKLIRVDTQKFKPSKSQKRVLKKNKDLKMSTQSASFVQAHFELFVDYTARRHQRPCDPDTTQALYEYNILFEKPLSHLAEFRDEQNELLAVCAFDLTDTAIMLHQSFFDIANHPNRSLGTLVILKMIELAKAHNIEHVYLGHWVSSNSKMRYKTNFRPFQIHMGDAWTEVE